MILVASQYNFIFFSREMSFVEPARTLYRYQIGLYRTAHAYCRINVCVCNFWPVEVSRILSAKSVH